MQPSCDDRESETKMDSVEKYNQVEKPEQMCGAIHEFVCLLAMWSSIRSNSSTEKGTGIM